MNYPITIIETSSKTVHIEADNPQAALANCQRLYNDSEIVLDITNDIKDIRYSLDNVYQDKGSLVFSNLVDDIYKVDGVTLDEMQSKSNSPRIATARRVYAYIGVYNLHLYKKKIADDLSKSRGAITMLLKLWDDNEYKRADDTALYAEVLNKYNK